MKLVVGVGCSKAKTPFVFMVIMILIGKFGDTLIPIVPC